MSLPLIRLAEFENHNKDGGSWLTHGGKVYDVDEFCVGLLEVAEASPDDSNKDAVQPAWPSLASSLDRDRLCFLFLRSS